MKQKVENAFERVAGMARRRVRFDRAISDGDTSVETAQLLSEGYTLHDAARFMGVHYSTVFRHLKAATLRTGCKTQMQYVCLLYRNGAIQ
jgi:DNA-binding CsgD family transcriptional regulator